MSITLGYNIHKMVMKMMVADVVEIATVKKQK
jgi:hypothetical protein